MISALWLSASGMHPQQVVIDSVANNVANINTTGFKRDVVQFKSVFYEFTGTSGGPSPDGSGVLGLPVSTGGSTPISYKVFDQGRLEETGNPLDVAIDGDGFFRVILPDGTSAYTRDGGFKINNERHLVTPQGYKLEPSIEIPAGAGEVVIHPEGKVSVVMRETDEIQDVGNITLFKVKNSNGLIAAGGNLLVATDAAGEIVEQAPGSKGFGLLYRGFLEASNVEIANEMAVLVSAKGAYDFSSRAFKSADDMLTIATNIRG